MKKRSKFIQIDEVLNNVPYKRSQRRNYNLKSYYDLINCHSCKNVDSTSNNLTCCNDECKESYCINCIKKTYLKFNPNVFIILKDKENNKSWVCYKCRGICPCLICVNSRASGTNSIKMLNRKRNLKMKRSYSKLRTTVKTPCDVPKKVQKDKNNYNSLDLNVIKIDKLNLDRKLEIDQNCIIECESSINEETSVKNNEKTVKDEKKFSKCMLEWQYPKVKDSALFSMFNDKTMDITPTSINKNNTETIKVKTQSKKNSISEHVSPLNKISNTDDLDEVFAIKFFKAINTINLLNNNKLDENEFNNNLNFNFLKVINNDFNFNTSNNVTINGINNFNFENSIMPAQEVDMSNKLQLQESEIKNKEIPYNTENAPENVCSNDNNTLNMLPAGNPNVDHMIINANNQFLNQNSEISINPSVNITLDSSLNPIGNIIIPSNCNDENDEIINTDILMNKSNFTKYSIKPPLTKPCNICGYSHFNKSEILRFNNIKLVFLTVRDYISIRETMTDEDFKKIKIQLQISSYARYDENYLKNKKKVEDIRMSEDLENFKRTKRICKRCLYSKMEEQNGIENILESMCEEDEQASLDANKKTEIISNIKKFIWQNGYSPSKKYIYDQPDEIEYKTNNNEFNIFNYIFERKKINEDEIKNLLSNNQKRKRDQSNFINTKKELVNLENDEKVNDLNFKFSYMKDKIKFLNDNTIAKKPNTNNRTYNSDDIMFNNHLSKELFYTIYMYINQIHYSNAYLKIQKHTINNTFQLIQAFNFNYNNLHNISKNNVENVQYLLNILSKDDFLNSSVDNNLQQHLDDFKGLINKSDKLVEIFDKTTLEMKSLIQNKQPDLKKVENYYECKYNDYILNKNIKTYSNSEIDVNISSEFEAII